METMMILGFISAVLMGMTLGVFGAGGSILTVPILVFLMGISASEATAYSLFIVGITALFAAYAYYKKI
ncbi:MAG: TSUP family transporter [Mariprofundaceae bacterium]|nr:TSUP family transporter [Mariprofundaceae bacterium]